MKLRATTLALLPVVATVLVAIAPSTAGACNGSDTGHCYAVYDWQTPDASQLTPGISGYINVVCPPTIYDPTADITTDELWADLNDGSWVEGGVLTGEGTNGYPYTSPADFVAAERGRRHDPNLANFWELVYGWQAVAQNMNVQLLQEAPYGSSAWAAYTPGTGWIGVPGFSNDYAAVEVQAGLETTANSSRNFGVISSLAYEQPGYPYIGKWIYKWGTWYDPTWLSTFVNPGLTNIATGPQSNWGSAAWVDEPPGYYCTAVGVARTPPRAVLAAGLDTQAHTIAANLGDSTPTSITSVTNVPLGTAIASSGFDTAHAHLPTSLSTSVVQLTGHFTDTQAAAPRGHDNPTGTIATTVIDQSTGQPIAFGLSNSPRQAPSLPQLAAEERRLGARLAVLR
jgi:hypothetical protein